MQYYVPSLCALSLVNGTNTRHELKEAYHRHMFFCLLSC
jgi:hypothetical protein